MSLSSSSVNLTTVESQSLALLTQVLRVFLALVTDVQAIRSVQRSLLVRVDHEAALDAHLATVSPAVAAHPLAPAGRTLVLPEAPLLALVWRQACVCVSSREKNIREQNIT